MNRKSGNRSAATCKGKENSTTAAVSASQIRRRLLPKGSDALQDDGCPQEAPVASADKTLTQADEEWCAM